MSAMARGRGHVIEGALVSRPVVSRHGVFFWLSRTLVKVRYTFFLTALLLGSRSESVASPFVWVAVLFPRFWCTPRSRSEMRGGVAKRLRPPSRGSCTGIWQSRTSAGIRSS